MKQTEARRIEILSVEDSRADQVLIAEMLSSTSRRHHITFVENGQEAMRFLRREGNYAEAPRPDLILLDLNLPGESGDEVLRKIRTDETFHKIPVLVLSSSGVPEDALKCEKLHANCYVTKPSDLDQFRVVLKAIESVCDGLQSNPWIEVSTDNVKKDVDRERTSRRAEREALKSRLRDLESRFAD